MEVEKWVLGKDVGGPGKTWKLRNVFFERMLAAS